MFVNASLAMFFNSLASLIIYKKLEKDGSFTSYHYNNLCIEL